MAPVALDYISQGGALRRWKRPDRTTAFILGVTQPTKQNSGSRLALASHAAAGFTSINAGGTYSGLDFQNTTLTIATTALVTLNDCIGIRQLKCSNAGAWNVQANHVSFRNVDNNSYSGKTSAAVGHGFRLYRCLAEGYEDAVATYCQSDEIDGPINVSLEGNWLGDLSWWQSDTAGVVHPTDTETHNDVIGHQGGRGLRIVGNTIDARYSQTIGTGTPGNSQGAAGVSARQAANVDNGGLRNGGGGSLSGIQINGDRGTTPAMLVDSNWCIGGGYFLNAGDSTLTGDFGTITNNRVDRSQFMAGKVFGLRSNLTTTPSIAPGSGLGNNRWMDDNSLIYRHAA